MRELAATVTTISADTSQLQYATPEVKEGAGGILLFGEGGPVDLGTQIRQLRGAGIHGQRPIVMTDEEGGEVQRIPNLVGNLPWARSAALTLKPGKYKRLVRAVGLKMRRLGITMDLAPVLDLDNGPGPDAEHPDGQRSFSADPTIASVYGDVFVHAMAEAKVIAVAKHFPGLGTATANTDSGPALIASLPVLLRRDVVPFRSAIAAGVPAIMINNAVITGQRKLPVVLQRQFVTGLLRHQLGFRGLIVTDSLAAGAIAATKFTTAEAAVRALNAGADLILGGNLAPSDNASTFASNVNAIVAAVQAKQLPLSRLRRAASLVELAEDGSGCLQSVVHSVGRPSAAPSTSAPVPTPTTTNSP